MKKLFFAVLVTIVATCANASTTDTTKKLNDAAINAGIYGVHQNWDSKDFLIAWTTFTKGKFSMQNRINFDDANTFALIPGYICKAKKFTFVPEIGILYGNYKSVSTEFYGFTTFDSSIFSAYVLGQHSFGIGDNNSFVYCYGQGLWAVDKNQHLKVGIGAQYRQQTFAGEQKATLCDMGPQLLMSFWNNNMYVKLWPTYDPLTNHWKSIIGLGVTL